MEVRGRKGAVLTGRDSRNGGGDGVEQRKQRNRGKVEDDWTDLQFSKVPGTCL
jgi:hypothetical protein